jgi:hypothetical protein
VGAGLNKDLEPHRERERKKKKKKKRTIGLLAMVKKTSSSPL